MEVKSLRNSVNDLVNPVRRTALVDEVVGQLEDLITTGTLGEGDRLPSETDLAKQLGVGRGTAREAIIVLAARGFLSRSRRGTFVLQRRGEDLLKTVAHQRLVELTQMEQLLEARQLLEAELASLCAARCTDEDLEEMSQSMVAMVEAEERGDVAAFSSADAEFHFLIAQGAQNEVLGAMLSITRDLMVKAIYELLVSDAAMRTRALDFHRSILDAIRKENPSLARQAVIAHLVDIGEAMSRLRLIKAGDAAGNASDNASW